MVHGTDRELIKLSQNNIYRKSYILMSLLSVQLTDGDGDAGDDVKYEVQFKLRVKSRPSQLFFNFFILKSRQLSD